MGHRSSDVGIDRRRAVGILAAVPLAAGFDVSALDLERAARTLADLRRRGQQYQPRFFTPHEWETVRILVDLIIPRDERSGSATDAGVPEFMDFIMTDQETQQTPMRGGLAWLDTECRERFAKTFAECAEPERRAVLDDIAWPARAKPELSHGVEFFNRFRDLTATGFWSSKMGVEDLQYIGNTFAPDWNGCSEEQLRKLGVSYGDE
ncbi:MAG: gluconate 2-dehydrogenase subunit 3 family protein [Gemmatimonadetes bacterium]|nr:gluconate 2-dehydrogenase subunit 3 family protein [Gemmatimonadota bacterium]